MPRGARTVRGPLLARRPSFADDTARCQGASLIQKVTPMTGAWLVRVSVADHDPIPDVYRCRGICAVPNGRRVHSMPSMVA